MNVPDEGIVHYGVRVVKVKCVLEMVGLRKKQGQEKGAKENHKDSIVFLHPLI